MNAISPLGKKLLVLGACYAVVASALVTYFQAPLGPVLAGGILVLVLALVQHFTANRGRL